MATTKLWVVQQALQTIFTTKVPDTVEVFRGPRGRSNVPKRFVLIGTDGGETGLGDTDDGMSAQQTPSAYGPGGWRDEAGSVVCSSWAWSGSDLKQVRDDAQALFDVCEGAVFADRSLDGVLVAPGLAEITGVGIRETQIKNGPVVRVVFTVSYGALITSEENPA